MINKLTKQLLIRKSNILITTIALFIFLTGSCYAQPLIQNFIENKGQWEKSVLYATDIPGGKLFFQKHGLTYVFSNHNSHANNHHFSNQHQNDSNYARKHSEQKEDVVKVEFVDANTLPSINRENEGNTFYNYFIGNDKSNWGVNCKGFESITYTELYENVDLKFYYSEENLKYDIILKKKADPKHIKFKYNGVKALNIKKQKLIIDAGINTIVENKPYSFQVIDGQKIEVSSRYQLNGNELSFVLTDEYDETNTLIIDPELIFSSFSGATSDNFGYTACFDEDGNLYSGGISFGVGHPSTNGTRFIGGTDIAILKYDSTGTQLKYATYIGGISEDAPHSLVVNHKNELVILGTTGSANFPVSENAFDKTFNGGTPFSIFNLYAEGSDLIITKLDDSGNILASTFVGGPGNDGILKLNGVGVFNYQNELIQNYGDYVRGDIIMDDQDNLYIASSTDSTGFPISSNIQQNYIGGNSDGVVFSFDTDLKELLWSTYLGGGKDDAAFSIKLDSDKNVYVGGGTSSDDFPTTNNVLNLTFQGVIDGFITVFDVKSDTIMHSTYLGTNAYDQAYFIDLDLDENVYAYGQTRGSYPISDNVYFNSGGGQFVHKLSNDLSTTLFSTVFGSGGNEPNISPTAFSANQCDNLFLSGWGGNVNNNNSSNQGNTRGMAVTSNAYRTNTDGSDFYYMVLSADGSELMYATFFGSLNSPGDHVDGGTSRFDKRGIMYQSSCTCGGNTDDFPTTTGAWATTNGSRCNNTAVKFDLASLNAKIDINTLDGLNAGLTVSCAPVELVFNNVSIGGERILWNFGDGTSSTQEMVTHFFEPGTYLISLTVWDENTCIGVDQSFHRITVLENSFSVSEAQSVCQGGQVSLLAEGGTSYEWYPAENLNNAFISNPIATPDISTWFRVDITTGDGCVYKDSVRIRVVLPIIYDFEVIKDDGCEDNPNYSFVNKSQNTESFNWNFGDGSKSDLENPGHVYNDFGVYNVNLSGNEGGCFIDKSLTIDYQKFFVPNVFTPNNDGYNDSFEINSNLDFSLQIFDRVGKEVYNAINYNNDWTGKDFASGTYFYHIKFSNAETCKGWVKILR